MGLADFFPALFDQYFLKLIFLIHATLISFAAIAANSNDTRIAYLFYNTIFLVVVVLAILVEKSADVALTGAVFNGVCIVLDIVLLVAKPYVGLLATLIIVFNLVLRALSTILLLRNYSARAGVEDPTQGFLEVNVHQAAPQARSAYQNIDEPSQTLP